MVFTPLSSPLLPFLIPSSHIIFGLCFCFPSVQSWISWTISTEKISGLLSQISDKHEGRTVGCSSLSSTAPWKATLASQWPQWSLLPETGVCVSWRSRSAERRQSYYIGQPHLIGKRQGVDVLPKFSDIFNFFPHYKILIFFLLRLQSFPAWTQKLICERWV